MSSPTDAATVNSKPTTFKVVFQPSGRSGKVTGGTSVLEAARTLGVGIEAICAGAGTCGKCQVIIEGGHFAKHDLTSHPAHVTPADAAAHAICARRGLPAGGRPSRLHFFPGH